MPAAWGESSCQVKRWCPEERGDDPAARTIHPALGTGIGSGKAFFFLFGLRSASPGDQAMLERELAHIDDDIEVLRGAGYTVIVDSQATRRDFIETVTGRGVGAEGLIPAGFYWSAHGFEDGSIQCCDGERVHPDDLEGLALAPGLRLAIFGACYVGSRSRTWRKALGGSALVVGWGRPVTIDRAVDFLDPDPRTSTDLDDLIARFLLSATPLPQEAQARHAAAEPALLRGRIAGLRDRVEPLAGALGAAWREADNHLELRIPLEGNRFHLVRVFTLDALEPFVAGEPLFGAEAEVGELSPLVDLHTVLNGQETTGFARVALVRSQTEEPNIVTQGFLPLVRASEQDLAALVFQVAEWADELEQRIFGGDLR